MREEARVAAAGRAAISSAGGALIEERVVAAVLASLEQAGVVKNGSTDMSAQVRGICRQWGAGRMETGKQGLVPRSVLQRHHGGSATECRELRRCQNVGVARKLVETI